MNVTPVLTDTPNAASAPANAAENGIKSARAKPNITAFKKQLKDYVEHDETANTVQAAGCSINNNDNSSVNDTMAQHGKTVGILEGFGLLDYLKGFLIEPAENTMPFAQRIQHTDAVMQEKADAIFAALNETGSSEQFAWMLSKDEPGKLPPDVQQQIISLAKEYLGSLESTNNAGSADKIEHDGLISLLLRLKTEHKPAHELNVPTEERAELEHSTVFQTKEEAVQIASDKGTVIQTSDMGTKSSAARQTAEVESKPHSGVETATEFFNVQVNDSAKFNVQVNDSAKEMQNDSLAVKSEAADTSLETDFVKDNVIRIVDKISTQKDNGRYEFDVALKPEFLGKLNIRLTLENGSLRMQIKAQDAGVKGLMCEQMPALQALLKDKGLSVTHIDVTYQNDTPSGSGYEAYRHQNNGQDGSKQHRARHLPEWLQGAGLYDAMATTAEYYLGGSSVEYLA